MKELDTKLDELKKIYIKKPTETINELNQVIIKLKNDETNVINDKKVSKKVLVGGLFAAYILLVGITNIGYGMDYFMMYVFGTAFFLAGLFVGMYVPVFGIIFLFSHGCTGLGIMCLTKITQILSNPIMTDNPGNLKNLLILGSGLIIVGIVSVIIFNVSEKFRNSKYGMLLTLGTLGVGITIVQILPYMFNITLKAL